MDAQEKGIIRHASRLSSKFYDPLCSSVFLSDTVLLAISSPQQELESLTIDRESMQLKDSIALKYAELVAGRWFDPLRESMDAFMQKITETIAGSVSVTSRKSPYSLYRQDFSSFESSQIYDQADATGFVRLYGLPMRV